MEPGWIRTRIAIAGSLVLFAGGCAPQRVGGGSAADDGLVQGEAGSSCTAGPTSTDGPTEVTVPIPADLVAVAATRCRYTFEPVSGDGEYMFRLEERVDGDLTDLVRQLRLPSETTGRGTGCAAIGLPDVIITLLDAAGTALVPTIPRAVCGNALPGVLRAIHALRWQLVRQVKLQQTQSELEVSSGCGSGWKPIIELDAGAHPGLTPSLASLFATPPARMLVCHYELDPTGTISDGDKTFRMGTLSTAATLTGAPLTAFLAAVVAARPATGGCTAPQAPFAVVSDVGGKGPTLVVEIGGCHRFDDGLGNLYQLDPSITLP